MYIKEVDKQQYRTSWHVFKATLIALLLSGANELNICNEFELSQRTIDYYMKHLMEEYKCNTRETLLEVLNQLFMQKVSA